MTETDGQGRTDPPIAADETATLLGFLDYQRATFEWKTSGLDTAGLTATVGVSSMTLGGMIKHAALNEDAWFGRVGDEPLGPPWDTVDWDADPDWEWHTAADDSPEQLHELWRAAVERSRSRVAAALATGGMDQPTKWSGSAAGWSPSLRWVVCHMIEEYARHNGHADLIREWVDGLTGE